MTYRGRIKNGVVVLEGPEAPPEGAEVTVNLVDSPANGRSKSRRPGGLSSVIGAIKDSPPDLSTNLDHYLYGTAKRK